MDQRPHATGGFQVCALCLGCRALTLADAAFSHEIRAAKALARLRQSVMIATIGPVRLSQSMASRRAGHDRAAA